MAQQGMPASPKYDEADHYDSLLVDRVFVAANDGVEVRFHEDTGMLSLEPRERALPDFDGAAPVN